MAERTEIDVAQDFKTRYMGHVNTIKTEYERQLKKWKPYFEVMADAQAVAAKSLQDTVTLQAQAQARAAQVAMAAVGMVGGVALGWLSGVLKNALTTKFSNSPVFKDMFVDGEYHVIQVTGGTVGETAALAGFFADTLQKGTQHVFDAVLAKVMPTTDIQASPKPSTQALRQVIEQGDYASFKTRITAALDEESLLAYQVFGTLHGNINNDNRFGDKLLEKVKEEWFKKFPKIKPTITALEKDGEKMIDQQVDKLREEYAKDWFYYGNNPDIGMLMDLNKRVEKQMWALWILDQQYKPHVIQLHTMNSQTVIYGNDKVKLGRPIISRIAVDLLGGGQAMLDLEHSLRPTNVVDYIDPDVVDTIPELAVVLGWAYKYRTIGSGYGSPSFRKRNLGTVANPTSVFR